MTNAFETSGRFPALSELGTEFARVAAAERTPARRLRLRRVMVAVAVGLAVVPAGYAVAQSGEGDVPESENASAIEAQLNDPDVAARIGTTVPIDLATLRQYYADLEARREAAVENPKDVNKIGESMNPDLVEQCRANANSSDLCGIALASADGKLPPGNYTDQELEDAVRAAGYEWSPSD